MTTWREHPALAGYLSRQSRVLLSDIDGTLSPITADPQASTVDPDCRELLRRLASRLELVGFITGRPVSRAREMVGLDEVVYVGNHGLEWWRGGGVEPLPELERWRERLAEARRRLAAELPSGARLEDKGWALGLHFREHPQTEEALTELARSVARELELRMERGRMVVELAPPVTADKGTALREILAAARPAAALYMGDDRTDVDAFRALREWPGHGVAVGVLSPESPPEVRREAHLTVAGVEGVRALLGWLAEELGA